MGRRTEQGTTWLKSRFKWPRSRCGPRLDGRPPDANAPAAQLPGRSLSGVAGSHHARAAFFALRQCRCFFFASLSFVAGRGCRCAGAGAAGEGPCRSTRAACWSCAQPGFGGGRGHGDEPGGDTVTQETLSQHCNAACGMQSACTAAQSLFCFVCVGSAGLERGDCLKARGLHRPARAPGGSPEGPEVGPGAAPTGASPGVASGAVP
jgi:hypothetical protein